MKRQPVAERPVALPPRRERSHADSPATHERGLLRSPGDKNLTATFDTAWQVLKTSGNVLAADFQAASTRELLAKRIIETGRQGERNPLRLAEDALAHLANYQKGT